MPSKNNFFPSAEDYNRLCNGQPFFRNCLKFSMGDSTPAQDYLKMMTFNIEPLPEHEKTGNDLDDLAKAFLKTVDNYKPRRKFNSTDFRRIYSEDELQDGEYIFKVLGFLATYPLLAYEYHIMRGMRDCSNGIIQWEHKMGWFKSLSRKATSSDFTKLTQIYGDKFVLFAFAPPKH